MQHDDINHCTAENAMKKKKAKHAVQSATGKKASVYRTKTLSELLFVDRNSAF